MNEFILGFIVGGIIVLLILYVAFGLPGSAARRDRYAQEKDK